MTDSPWASLRRLFTSTLPPLPLIAFDSKVPGPIAHSPSRRTRRATERLVPPAGIVPAQSDSFERDAAAASRAYHDWARKAYPLEDRRKELSRFARDFYRNRLHVRPNLTSRATFDALADPETLLIEMAHDGQLPHLGIVRLVLKSHAIARQDPKALTLYLVGNHYSANMRPENLRFGAPLKGGSPDDVKHPPKVRVGRAHANTPFRLLRPPSAHGLNALRDQISDFVENNLAHEEKAGRRKAPDAKERMTARLEDLFQILNRAARDVDSLGDWLIRVQYDLFRRMLGREANRIVFLPMADLTNLLHPELATVAERADEVSAIKAEVGREQLASGIEPYTRTPQESPLWAYCPSCFRRSRNPWIPGTALELRCPYCRSHVVLAAEEAWKWTMPDIVGYEAALFRLGISGWVVGSHAPYHPVIERTYARLFGTEMPPKFFLTSVPVFRGIGDPREGYKRTRLLRALLEMEAPAVAKALNGPWTEDPLLRSDLLDS